MNPGYMFGMPLEHAQVVGEKRSHRSFENTDQFGEELRHFSDCILHDRDPEPDGEEGHADVRVLEGIVRALESGRPEMLAPFTRGRRIDTANVQTLAARRTPELVNASSPGRDKERGPKNWALARRLCW